MIKEFKEFISRGNVMDMAVGVIMGNAFGKIVTSVVNDIIMPLIGVLIGGINFTNLSIEIGNSKIMYGNFIQNVIDFLIIAVCIFIFVKLINKLNNIHIKKKEEEKSKPEKVVKKEEILLLEEIRDLLKKENKIKNKK